MDRLLNPVNINRDLLFFVVMAPVSFQLALKAVTLGTQTKLGTVTGFDLPLMLGKAMCHKRASYRISSSL